MFSSPLGLPSPDAQLSKRLSLRKQLLLDERSSKKEMAYYRQLCVVWGDLPMTTD